MFAGLYKVEKSWFTIGMSGFGVWKFAMRRVKDQALPPWVTMQDGEEVSSYVSNYLFKGGGLFGVCALIRTNEIFQFHFTQNLVMHAFG